MKNSDRGRTWVSLAILFFAFTLNSFSQPGTATLRGVVTDPSGATVPGATISLTGKSGARQTKSDNVGVYSIPGLQPGAYDLRVAAKGFADYQTQGLQVATGAMSFDIPMVVATEASSVTVSSDQNRVNTDPSQNVGAIVLNQEDLKMLSDDPDDLESDLQALAGPAAGPNGGQIFIDGFSGGKLPPKESIREIRINSNPLSAEYDRMGFGRIEVFTRPGTDKFRGSAFMNFGDKIFNTRNPFVKGDAPDYQMEMFGGNISGPINKRSSFFLDVNRRMIDENAAINTTVLDSALNIVPYSAGVVTPIRRTDVSPRIDYAINPNNTLVARYTWGQNSSNNQGLGSNTLPTNAIDNSTTDHTVQLTETAVIGSKMINEVRFQFFSNHTNSTGNSVAPTISVQGAFTGGSAPISVNYTNENHYEFHESVSLSHGSQQLKFGARVREVTADTQSTSNYNGTFSFASIEIYRQTLLGLQQGLTGAQIRALGYGPLQFSILGGTPQSSIGQFDAGLFFQDDWRAKPNLTISLGARYETQTNIGDHGDLAPRIGLAWAPGAKKGAQPKMVYRAGFGIFFDRFDYGNTLQAMRQNGLVQQDFVISNPDFYPTVPSVSSLVTAATPQAIRKVASNLDSPRINQAVAGFDRQLPYKITWSMNYIYSRGTHQLRSRDINAPLPGTYDPTVKGSGTRPYGTAAGDIYLYESSGSFRQQQVMTNLRATISPKISLMGFYVYGRAFGNTDGAGGFPANQYDTKDEWGRTAYDSRHRAFIGGSLTAPWKVQFNPFIIMNSGSPFNITSGPDLNGDGILNDRPAYATDLSRASVVKTAWGTFDTRPMTGATIIPRNAGEGPGTVSVNLRVSRSWGFGERKTAQGDSMNGGFGPPPGGGGGGGPRGGGGPGGGMMMGGGGMRGMGGFGGGSAGNNRFLLTASINSRNVINHVNLGSPVGILSSPQFGESVGLASGFGGPGGGGAAGNRRIEFSLRLSF